MNKFCCSFQHAHTACPVLVEASIIACVPQADDTHSPPGSSDLAPYCCVLESFERIAKTCMLSRQSSHKELPPGEESCRAGKVYCTLLFSIWCADILLMEKRSWIKVFAASSPTRCFHVMFCSNAVTVTQQCWANVLPGLCWMAKGCLNIFHWICDFWLEN